MTQDLEHFYSQLDENNVHWGRTNDNTLFVWTSGYKTANHIYIQEFAQACGLRCMKENYDSLCGKTISTNFRFFHCFLMALKGPLLGTSGSNMTSLRAFSIWPSLNLPC